MKSFKVHKFNFVLILLQAEGSRRFLFYPNQLRNLQREDKGAAVIFPKPSAKSMPLLCPETPKMSVEVRALYSLKEEHHHFHFQ